MRRTNAGREVRRQRHLVLPRRDAIAVGKRPRGERPVGLKLTAHLLGLVLVAPFGVEPDAPAGHRLPPVRDLARDRNEFRLVAAPSDGDHGEGEQARRRSRVRMRRTLSRT